MPRFSPPASPHAPSASPCVPVFRVCHDLLSVFGFGFSFLCDSRLCGVVVFAMYPLSVLLVRHADVREVLTV